MNIKRNNMETHERKPYYILRMNSSNLVLHEGIGREVYPHYGNTIQLYLTDEEVQKYDGKKVNKVLEQYSKIIKKRYMYMPVELILYAICEVLYEEPDKQLKLQELSEYNLSLWEDNND